MKKLVCTTLLIESSPQSLPLGAACIASAIKNNEKTKNLFDVKLIFLSKEDKEFQKENPELSFAKKITDDFTKIPDFVLFSVYVWNKKESEECAKLLKTKNPSIFLIAGGPEVSANPTSLKNFDYCIVGEGENSSPLLLEKILKNQNPPKIFSSPNPSLESLSSPYLDGTLDPKIFDGALWELSRGCPFKCSYCFESKGEKTVRNFPLKRIEDELILFNQKKINQVFVLDPTYNANKERALSILRMIQKNAPGMFFYFEARAEFINRQLAKEFSKIPCALQIGLQSSNPQILKYVNRSLDKNLFCKNISILNQEGVIFGFDLIYGLPKDNLKGFLESVDFALKLYPNNLETFRLSVLPGTSLFENAKNLGLIWETAEPYNIIETDNFCENDLKKAEEISYSINIFYNYGRAVPYFLSLCKATHLKPSEFFQNFSEFCKKNKINTKAINDSCLPHSQIEKIQCDFIEYIFLSKPKLKKVAKNIICFNGAISRATSDKTKQTIKLDFHPDALSSPYATDLVFFAKNCREFKNQTDFFWTKNGVDWKVKSHN